MKIKLFLVVTFLLFLIFSCKKTTHEIDEKLIVFEQKMDVSDFVKEATGYSYFTMKNQAFAMSKANDMIYDQIVSSKYTISNGKVSVKRDNFFDNVIVFEEKNIPVSNGHFFKEIKVKHKSLDLQTIENSKINVTGASKTLQSAYRNALIDAVKQFTSTSKIDSGKLIVSKVSNCNFKNNVFSIDLEVAFFK
ncbi:MAG: hypothetical protein A2015_00530 [Spirochaetes bacterium GWF1_31_7]|nr:MAG: hypothetical protein A2Y30_03980 [Spirochaetes bacterium GWE1_32_154]OHD45159.1 MAG: hypothetical protein A2Y29_15915 [Spirochaetes bacterium GWE2_31_10]OHD51068.1 MAG: hypothetical protein A2015_00530 [Spirochaetes bacterium GWF1_31_7]HBD94392.1 hypothetical protein [Spirochaetia bacterium]HBI37855.1 hypothetical protein [Spirochaetia bacterium]